MVVFLFKSNENTYPKGRPFMKMYRVVPITKRGNCTVSSCYVGTKCTTILCSIYIKLELQTWYIFLKYTFCFISWMYFWSLFHWNPRLVNLLHWKSKITFMDIRSTCIRFGL